METQEQLERLAVLGRRPLFSSGGTTYLWVDVLARGSEGGALDDLRRSSRHGVACARRAEALGDRPDDETLRDAATRFRYERGLLSAEELQAWLVRWGLTVEEWSGYLERSLLLERWAAELDPIEAEFVPDAAATAEAEYVDAVCSGTLEREAHALAAEVALANLPPGAAPEQIRAAAAAARADAAAPAAVEREIASRRLDWTRLELEQLCVPDEGVAAEAVLCVRVDGRTLADVADDCGAVLDRRAVYLADTGPRLAAALLGAQPGELVGPIEEDGSFLVAAVNGRALPQPDDPELRRRAETLLLDRAVERAVESRVEWHDDV